MTRAGAIASFLLFGYSIVTAILLAVVGGPPETAAEAFALLQRRPFIGWLRLDVLTVVFMPMYYVLTLGLWAALQHTNRVSTAISSTMVVIGVTLFMSAPTVFSLARLSELHARASSDSRRGELIAAAESVLAADIWHGSAALFGGLLLEAGLVWISALMLRPESGFPRWLGLLGLATHGLDLLHGPLALIWPRLGSGLMMAAGPLYLLWFPVIGLWLWKTA
jgi:hypothetical protein